MMDQAKFTDEGWWANAAVRHFLIGHWQVAENEACLREYGLPPAALLGREGLLGPDFTAVHAIHITSDEIELLARANTTVC